MTVVVTVAVLGPMLLPGSPLRYDLVSVPEQPMTPDVLGLGDRLPRAVPLDAATWLLAHLVGGWVTQVLGVGALLLAGTGAAALAAGLGVGVPGRAVAAVTAICNPFVLEQLAIGHVPHLVSYGCLAWAGLFAHQLVRRFRAAGAARLAAVLVLGSITPGGGVLCAGVALTGAVLGALPSTTSDSPPGPVSDPAPGPASTRPPVRGSWRQHRAWPVLGVALLALLTQAPWLTAYVTHPGQGRAMEAGQVRAAVQAFSVRSETGLGPLVDVLGLGGMWNAQALPPGRATVLPLVGSLLVLTLAAIGVLTLRRAGHARVAVCVAAAPALLGYLIALTPVIPGGTNALVAVIQAVPGAGLLRDGHRWLAWPALTLAVMVGVAAERLGRVVTTGRPGSTALQGRQAGARRVAVAIALAALVVACVPDLFGGLGGRLAARSYPADWATAREVLARADDRSRLLVLPWQPFRRFSWSGGTVLDPAPRYFPREAVVADALTVGTVRLSEEGPLAREVQVALADGTLDEAELSALGIGWVLVQRGTPGEVPNLPGVDAASQPSPGTGSGTGQAYSSTCLLTLLDGRDLALYRVCGPPPNPADPATGRRVAVLTALLAPPVTTAGLILLAGLGSLRRRGARWLLPYRRVQTPAPVRRPVG